MLQASDLHCSTFVYPQDETMAKVSYKSHDSDMLLVSNGP